jgi:hypothetical protein
MKKLASIFLAVSFLVIFAGNISAFQAVNWVTLGGITTEKIHDVWNGNSGPAKKFFVMSEDNRKNLDYRLLTTGPYGGNIYYPTKIYIEQNKLVLTFITLPPFNCLHIILEKKGSKIEIELLKGGDPALYVNGNIQIRGEF